MRIGPACAHAFPQAPLSARHEPPRYQARDAPPNSEHGPLLQVNAAMAVPVPDNPDIGCPTGGQSCAPLRWAIPEARRSTMSEKTMSVSTMSITPVISSRTNPCNAAQNSSEA